ncbi:Myb domain [Phytophthora cactorum]|nr:Myb domain [Phytophthora cactorum]
MSRTTRRKGTRPRLSREGEGVWTPGEHARFLEAVELYPHGPWKLVAAYIGTRSTRQAMTHAQKYRQKLERRRRGLRNAPSKRTKTETPSWPTRRLRAALDVRRWHDGRNLAVSGTTPLKSPNPIYYADTVEPAWVDDCISFFVDNFSSLN